VAQVGRISGAILKDNLLRQGIDLAFENDLVYLKVASNTGIGIKNNAPNSELDVSGTTATTNLESTVLTVSPNIEITNNNITAFQGNIYFNAADKIQTEAVETANININNNVISTKNNENLELRPNQSPTFPSYAISDITVGQVKVNLGTDTNPGTYVSGGTINFNGSTANIFDIVYDSFNNDLIITLSNSFSGTEPVIGDTIIIENVTLNNGSTDFLWYLPTVFGNVAVESNWYSYGNIHSTGDITFGGNMVLGDDDTDSVDFEADVASDIIPDATDTYDLGSSSKRWASLHTDLVNGRLTEVDSINVNGTLSVKRQGNIFYVSINGDDTNVGDHQHGAFRTIEHALSIVDASSGGPVTIHIFPGEYEEAFPLVVPENVTISGEDLRNVIVKPTNATNTNNAFELTHNTTIENITIKDFYAPGYAFVFQNGTVISERSPYIRNVTVITQGSFTYENVTDIYDAGDAAGGVITDTFDGGSASTEVTNPTDILDGLLGTTGTVPGGGAYIDGGVLDSATLEGSMLFHSCTFITPGVDCITMTNGVRVEWLNCFTYFASVGLQAEQGISGLGGNGVRYGAELRSINSANIYGNYGAIANGADTLMYLITHNFAYIGSGTDVNNDPSLALQDQETVELNNGKIYYVTTDHEGAFRVGDSFFINFEDGTTSFNIGEVSLQDVSAIFISTNESVTYIDGEQLSTGNLIFSGNTIQSVSGDLIWSPNNTQFLISTNASFIIPRGTTAERSGREADLRYNTNFNSYEGYGQSDVSFNGVYSQDRQTNISADTLIDNNLVFNVNGLEQGRLIPGALEFNNIQIDDININGNILQTTTTDTDLLMTNTSTEVVNIDSLSLFDSVIETNGILSISHTGQGYLKFDSTGGVVIPTGDTANRAQNPEVGQVRFNSDIGTLEIWSGTQWVNVVEDSEGASQEDMEEFLNLYVLVLG